MHFILNPPHIPVNRHLSTVNLVPTFTFQQRGKPAAFGSQLSTPLIHYQLSTLHYPQLRIIQHDLLLPVLLKQNRSDWVVGAALYFLHSAKAEL
jgi:hypothetical protein